MILQKVKKYWFLIAALGFIVANSFFIAHEIYYFSLLPVVLLIIYAAFFSLDKLMWFIVFFTPLSINLEKLDLGGIGMYLPTEPLMFGIMILFFLKLLYEKQFDRQVISHPITVVILFQLGWIFITAFTSELPLVSFKFFVSRLWFVICFYFIATQLFKDFNNIKTFIWLYIIPLTMVIIYASVRLFNYSFDDKAAHWVMEPFFKDHTSYGAILALYFPFVIYLFQYSKSPLIRFLLSIIFVIFIIGIILSYTRAAWVSLVAAFMLYVVYKLKIKFKYLFAFTVMVGAVLAFNWNTILMKLEKNRQDSSDELASHVESISNVSTDASNLERLNRWHSAWRMFKKRPVFGWGPGTYAFVYAPFQLSYEKTIISTNAGDMGNAHSEYLGPLSEQGVLGMLAMVLLVAVVYYYGSYLYHRLPEKELKGLALTIVLSLTTYFVHGVLNNYLDTDKASVPFWGFIAALVAIDVYSKNKTTKEIEASIR